MSESTVLSRPWIIPGYKWDFVLGPALANTCENVVQTFQYELFVDARDTGLVQVATYDLQLDHFHLLHHLSYGEQAPIGLQKPPADLFFALTAHSIIYNLMNFK